MVRTKYKDTITKIDPYIPFIHDKYQIFGKWYMLHKQVLT